MNEIKSKGFILRVIQTQEADLILKIMLSNGEKISAFARAAMKSKKRFEGGLQILTQIEFRAHKKENADLWILEESKLTFEFKNLPLFIEAYGVANYLSELTEHCSHEGLENPPLYNLFGAAMRALDKQKPAFVVMTSFELKLLALMGWSPDLQSLSDDQRAVVESLLTQKLMDVSEGVDSKSLQKIESQIKANLLAHMGGGKLKSLEFLTSTLV